MKTLHITIIVIISLTASLVIFNLDNICYYLFWYAPLNDMKIEPHIYSPDGLSLQFFNKIKNMEGSTCITTPSKNYFCYSKPRMFENGGVSYISDSNGIEGELHFSQVGKEGGFYFTIKNMTKINDNEAMITFSDKNYRMGNDTNTIYQINDKFQYSTTIKKFDTFISNCSDYKGNHVNIVQYLGTKTIGGVEYFITWHTLGDTKNGIDCKYPDIIKYSLRHHFGEL